MNEIVYTYFPNANNMEPDPHKKRCPNFICIFIKLFIHQKKKKKTRDPNIQILTSIYKLKLHKELYDKKVTATS